MAITILERPEGYVLGAAISATIIDNGSVGGIPGVAEILSFGHGLSDGDVIYVVSDIGEYNGFVTVDFVDADQLRLRNISDTEYLDYFQDVNCVYYSTIITHGWSAVHLPITYRLSNNLYPVNSSDTTRTVTTLTNNNGFVQLGLSGTLGTFEDLSFVKISSAPDSDLDGVYQIIDKLSTSSVILNLDYSSVDGAGILGASIQLYYSNYNVVVNVYAGINATHEWTAQKPYEIAATLELIPDENNEVFFSVNDILKAYVETENNLLLGTLPNNIDAWTNFYISTAESYDTSNGYAVTTFESEFTSDQAEFEGTAVNSKLEFKNLHSGYLSDYLMVSDTTKFLTLFNIPVLFAVSTDYPDWYQDISWLKIDTLPISVRKEFYLEGVGPVTVDEAITEESGVIRTQLEANCDYDRVDVSLIVVNEVNSYSVARSTVGQTTQDFDFFIPEGQAPPGDYSYSITFSGGTGSISAQTFYLNLDGTTETIVTVTRSTVGTTSLSATDLPVPAKTVIGVRLVITIVDGGGGITANGNNAFDIDEAAINVSETKQFKIDCNCSEQDIRLTWLNNLGGFDYWSFTGETDHTIDIMRSGETKKNIFPNWPKSYGSDADTIRKQTFRESSKREFIFSQFLTQDEADALAYIKSSVLVQVINSRSDRRTVIVDTDSFSKYKDGDKTYTISFNILYTDDIPSQTA